LGLKINLSLSIPNENLTSADRIMISLYNKKTDMLLIKQQMRWEEN